MANQKHLTILKKGVQAWNEWRTQNPGIKPDLSGADLREAILSGANLSKANLSLCAKKLTALLRLSMRSFARS